jgi:hypothetical protein
MWKQFILAMFNYFSSAQHCAIIEKGVEQEDLKGMAEVNLSAS